MSYTVYIQCPSEEAIAGLASALEQANLRVTRSFDLQAARAGQTGCGCPHHGAAPCTCQYAVLLVDDPAQAPRIIHTITVHGRDRQAWLSLLNQPASAPSAAHRTLEAKLKAILLALAAPEGQSPAVEADVENPLFNYLQ